MSTDAGAAAATGTAQRGLLRSPDFLKFWLGQTVSLVGSQVTDLALPLTAIITLHAGVYEIGLLNVARYTPYVVLSLFAGVWFDRHRRRPVLIASNAGRAVVIALVPAAALAGLLSMRLLYGIGFAAGLLTVLFDIGLLSYIPSLVERRHLTEANSKIQISYSIAGIGGPGLAGFLVGVLTAPVALALDAASLAFAAVTLVTIGKAEPEPAAEAERQPVFAAIGEGLRTVFGNPTLRSLALQSATFNLFENVVLTLFLVYAVRQLGVRPGELGLVVGAGSVGALVGAALSARMTAALGVGRSLLLCTLVACLSPLLLLTPNGAGAASLAVLGGALAAHGFGLLAFNVNAVTLRQSITPNHLLGRMNASYRLLLFGTVPLGGALGGLLGGLVGLRLGLTVGVVGVAAPIVWILFSPAYRLREMPGSETNQGD